MITKSILNFLHESIQEYDKKCNNTYLIAFNTGKNDELNIIQIQFNQKNFWHLLGCKLDEDSDAGKSDTYLRCKNKEDISDKVSKSSEKYSYSDIEKKYEAFMSVFDFVKNAKNIKLGYSKNSPEQFLFSVGLGNVNGIIGYDYQDESKKKFLIPKSAQNKKISLMTKDLKKILFILSKKNSNTQYITLEYEIKEGVFEELKTKIPENIKINLIAEDKKVFNKIVDEQKEEPTAADEAAATKIE